MIMNDNNTFVHFGQLGYEDFTKSLDENKKRLYLAWATNIKGNWKTNIYSPNMLSIILSWT